MKTERIDYYDGDVCLEAMVALPEGEGPHPLILIFPAWAGRGSFVEEYAVSLAKLGYIGCAMDPYGKGRFGKTKQECAALMHPLMEDRSLLQKRVLAYRDLLPKIPQVDLKKIGAIGFCFGGLCALDLARSGADIKGVVSFHGLLGAPSGVSKEKIVSKILVCHGYKDPMVSPDDLVDFAKEMTKENIDFQLHVFGEAMHAFTNPEADDPGFGTVYHEKSSQRSFILMKNFFAEIF